MMVDSYHIGFDVTLNINELSACDFELYPIPMHTYFKLHEGWSYASASSCWHEDLSLSVYEDDYNTTQCTYICSFIEHSSINALAHSNCPTAHILVE